MVAHDLKNGHPLTKLNQILQNLKKLQPNMEFDTSAAQLVFVKKSFFYEEGEYRNNFWIQNLTENILQREPSQTKPN